MTSDMTAPMKALEREVRELRQASEILKKASAYSAQPPPGGRRKPAFGKTRAGHTVKPIIGPGIRQEYPTGDALP